MPKRSTDHDMFLDSAECDQLISMIENNSNTFKYLNEELRKLISTCVTIQGFKKLVAYHRANRDILFIKRFDYFLERVPPMRSHPNSCPRVLKEGILCSKLQGCTYLCDPSRMKQLNVWRGGYLFSTNELGYLYPDFSSTGIQLSYTIDHSCFEWVLLSDWSTREICIVNTLTKVQRRMLRDARYEFRLTISSTGMIYHMDGKPNDGCIEIKNIEDPEDCFVIQHQGFDFPGYPENSYFYSAISTKYFLYGNYRAEQVEFYSRKSGKLIVVLDVWGKETLRYKEWYINYRDDGLMCFQRRPSIVDSEFPLFRYKFFDVNSMMKERLLEMAPIFCSNVLRSIAKHLFL